MTDTPSAAAFALSSDEPLGGAGPQIDTGLVRDLARILHETQLTTIEVEQGALRIRVAREALTQHAPVQHVAAAAPASAPLPPPSAPSPAGTEPAAPAGDAVKSPMVGTVYLQAQPGAAPFIKVGDKVNEGQTLVLIEAMKTMNPIPAPRAGVIKALLIGDAQPVEYGEPLVMLE